jgi:hypothetical protein
MVPEIIMWVMMAFAFVCGASFAAFLACMAEQGRH